MPALDARIAATMPAQGGSIPLDDDDELMVARQAAVEPVLWMIDQAQADGTLRSDVAFGDIGLVLMRPSRQLPQEFSRDLDSSLTHRYLALGLAGLRGEARWAKLLGGPAMALCDLRGRPTK